MRRAPRRASGTVGVAAAAALALSLLGCGARMGFERMQDQRRVDPWETSPLFADGKAMREPPPGSVPRERELGPPALVAGVAAGADVAAVPLPLDRALLRRGRDRFGIYCAVCHGEQGNGDSAVARAMSLRRPPSLLDPRVRALPAGGVYRVIRDGYGLMPAYGDELSIEDRWAVVAFLRALQLSRAVPLAALSPELRARAQRELELLPLPQTPPPWRGGRR